jgi:hypothetical protein
MDGRRRFQFSLANVLLMTFAVAWILAGASAAMQVRNVQLQNAAIVSVLLVLGISMAVGALVGGFKGMTRGFILGAAVLATIAILVYMLIVTWVVIRISLGGAN